MCSEAICRSGDGNMSPFMGDWVKLLRNWVGLGSVVFMLTFNAPLALFLIMCLEWRLFAGGFFSMLLFHLQRTLTPLFFTCMSGRVFLHSYLLPLGDLCSLLLVLPNIVFASGSRVSLWPDLIFIIGRCLINRRPLIVCAQDTSFPFPQEKETFILTFSPPRTGHQLFHGASQLFPLLHCLMAFFLRRERILKSFLSFPAGSASSLLQAWSC